MRFFIVRHAEAGDTMEDPAEDEKRPLTPEGRAQATALGKHMKDKGYEPTEIYASPFTRARQTAQLVRESFPKAKIKVEPSIAEGNSIRGLVKKLAGDDKKKRIAIVSHHDAIHHGLQALNFEDNDGSLDPFAKGEMRELDVDRDTGTWKEKNRCPPSDLGDYEDGYE